MTFPFFSHKSVSLGYERARTCSFEERFRGCLRGKEIFGRRGHRIKVVAYPESLMNCRQQMEAHAADNDRGTGYGIFEESPAVLKEKIRNLEVELRVARKNEGNVSQSASNPSSGNSNLEEKVLILESEIEDLQRTKKER